MSFDTSAYLRRATGRAKSDVANKLVSMFLHDVSRRLCSKLEMGVNDERYGRAVSEAFGGVCCYCGTPLENDRAAVEHLEGMNRFRVGLHIPGNVIVACTRCNREKRRDDSLPRLSLAETGWESFLSHDCTRCPPSCKTCGYWMRVWPEAGERDTRLKKTREKILTFRTAYSCYLEVSLRARAVLEPSIEAIYRDCQQFATTRIKEAVDNVLNKLNGAFSAEPAVTAGSSELG